MVYVMLGTGFEEMEAIAPIDILRRAGIQVLTVGLNGKTVYGSHGIGIETDITPEEMDLTQLEMIVLPGGLGGVASIRACEPAMEAVRFAWENNKFTAAICAAPNILADLHITDGLEATCYPSCADGMGSALMRHDAAAVQSGNVITGASAGCAVPFALKLVAALKGQAAADETAKQLVIRQEETV